MERTRYGVAVIGLLFFIGCGGDGNSNGSNGGNPTTVAPTTVVPTATPPSTTLASECVTYCAFACGKVVGCAELPASELASCANGCTAKIIQDGSGTAQACDAARGVVDGSTCSQLATLLGLPPPNTMPVANAGPAQAVTVGTTVHLDGSGSNDINGDPLTFRWTLITVPAGSAATLVNVTTPAPTFVPDVPGVYLVQLIVNDGIVNSTPKVVTITASSPPTPSPPPGLSCVPLPAGVVAWWSGDTSGQDISGHNQQAVLTSGASAGVTGKVGGAFRFDGSIGIANTSGILPLQGTLELWVNPTGLNAVHGILGTVGTANGDDRLWMVATGALGGPGVGPNRLVVNLGSRSANNLDIPNPLSAGTWTHLGLTFDYLADIYTLYVSGRAVATSTAARNAPTKVFSFGAVQSDFGQNFFFQGLLDEVTLYNRALAASELLAIVNADSAGKCK